MCPSSASFPFHGSPLSSSDPHSPLLFSHSTTFHLSDLGEALRSRSLGSCFVTLYKPACARLHPGLLSSLLGEVNVPSFPGVSLPPAPSRALCLPGALGTTPTVACLLSLLMSLTSIVCAPVCSPSSFQGLSLDPAVPPSLPVFSASFFHPFMFPPPSHCVFLPSLSLNLALPALCFHSFFR